MDMKTVFDCANSAGRFRKFHEKYGYEPPVPVRKPPRDVSSQVFYAECVGTLMFMAVMYVIGIML